LLVAFGTVLAGVTLGAPAAEAAGTDMYVDCSASASGTGTQASPLNSLAAINARTLSPGTSVLFKRGTTCAGTFAPQGSGVAGSPNVADSYGSGAKPIIAGGGAPDGILLNNVQYWEVRNLEVTNTGPTSSNRRGVTVRLTDYGTGHYYRLTDLTIHDVNGDLKKDLGGSSGIQFEVYGSAVQTRFEDVVIQGNDVYRVDRSGINMSTSWWCRPSVGCGSGQSYVGWGAFVVQDNTVHDIGGDGIVIQYASGSLVQRNVGYDINQRSGQLNNAGFWVWNADNVVFQHNEVYRVKRPAGTNDGNAFDADYGTDGTVFQYNYSHDNGGGMLLLCGCGGDSTRTVARYNISQNDGSRILMASGGTASFYNNTVYLPAGSTTKIVEQYGPADVNMSNNIFVNLGSGGFDVPAADASRYVYRNNVFFGNHPANEPDDPGKITSDPLLTSAGSATSAVTVSGYELRAGSPALASGTPVAANGGVDYLGRSVPATCGPDRGALQASAFDDSTCPVPGATGGLLSNAGFETTTLTPWTAWNAAGVVSFPTHTGSSAVRVGPGPASVEQVVSVEPNTTYVLTGWVRSAIAGEPTAIGVKGHGAAEKNATSTSTGWTQLSVPFTTGPTATGATIYVYKESGSGDGFGDDLQLRKSLVANGGFESPTLAPWAPWNTATRSATSPQAGSSSVQIGAAPSSVEQNVIVTPNTTYLLTGWVRVSTPGQSVRLGAKGFGGSEVSVAATDTAWSYRTTQFSTGPTATSATIYVYKDTGADAAWGDAVTLTELR